VNGILKGLYGLLREFNDDRLNRILGWKNKAFLGGKKVGLIFNLWEETRDSEFNNILFEIYSSGKLTKN